MDSTLDLAKALKMIKERDINGVKVLTVPPGMSFQEVLTFARQHVEEWSDCDVCWELHDLDFVNIDSIAMRKASEIMKEKASVRAGRKTAAVAKPDLGFGMLRMLQILLEEQTPTDIGVFRSTEEAMKWLAAD